MGFKLDQVINGVTATNGLDDFGIRLELSPGSSFGASKWYKFFGINPSGEVAEYDVELDQEGLRSLRDGIDAMLGGAA